MAKGGVFLTDTDGNIGIETTNLSEKVCGLLFDISAHSDFWTKGAGASVASTFKDSVVEFNTLDEVKQAGITAYTGEKDTDNVSQDLLFGIPFYHIEHFFKINGGSGRLFVAFADCKNDWNALIDMQKAANGTINQFGVWTEQCLWSQTDAAAESYSVKIVSDLQLVADTMADEYHAPATIILNANVAKVSTASSELTSVTFSKIPSLVTVNARRVAVAISQGLDASVSEMQKNLTSCTPVGNIGALLGELSVSNVAESIGYVMNHELHNYFPDIEFGFGDVSKVENNFKNTTPYNSLTSRQLDTLDDLGYIFLVKYAGLEGNVYFNGDATCSNGDYRTISRNRVINKSRRSIRTALLPYVNSPIKVNPSTGQLSAAQITVFKNLINDILTAMVNAEEIGGIGTIEIPATQNILKNDTLTIRYTMVPMGTAKFIEVTEGFVLKS